MARIKVTHIHTLGVHSITSWLTACRRTVGGQDTERLLLKTLGAERLADLRSGKVST